MDDYDEQTQEPVQCSQASPEETDFVAGNSQPGATKLYECQMCNKTFLNAHQLFSHELRSHEHVGTSQTDQIKKLPLLKYSQCEKVFSSQNDVHQTEIHNRNLWTDASDMRNSQKQERNPQTKVSQKQDGTPQTEALDTAGKSGKQYGCKICSEIFSSSNDLMQHEIKTHDWEIEADAEDMNGEQGRDTAEACIGVYMCCLCKETFNSETEVTTHEIMEHDGVTSDQNAYLACEESFISESQEIKFELDHNKESEFLQQDDGSFESNYSVEEEETMTEAQKLPKLMTSSESLPVPSSYKCPTCEEYFETKCHLFYHDLEVHIGVRKSTTVQSNIVSLKGAQKNLKEKTTLNEGGMKRIANNMPEEQQPMKMIITEEQSTREKDKEKQKVDKFMAKQVTFKKIWKADAGNKTIQKVIMKKRIMQGEGMKMKVESEKLDEYIQKTIEAITGKNPWDETSVERGEENKVNEQGDEMQPKTFVIVKDGSQSGEGKQKIPGRCRIDVVTNYVLSRSQVKQLLMNAN
jgi:hypothetical protein